MTKKKKKKKKKKGGERAPLWESELRPQSCNGYRQGNEFLAGRGDVTGFGHATGPWHSEWVERAHRWEGCRSRPLAVHRESRFFF